MSRFPCLFLVKSFYSLEYSIAFLHSVDSLSPQVYSFFATPNPQLAAAFNRSSPLFIFKLHFLFIFIFHLFFKFQASICFSSRFSGTGNLISSHHKSTFLQRQSRLHSKNQQGFLWVRSFSDRHQCFQAQNLIISPCFVQGYLQRTPRECGQYSSFKSSF